MATYIAEAVRDSYLVGVPVGNQSVNYGGAAFSSCQAAYALGSKSALARAIGNFDVSPMAGREIVSASLVLEYNLALATAECTVARCTRPDDWIESQVTWKNYRNGAAWTSGGGDFDDAGPPAAVTFNSPSSTGSIEVSGMEPFVADALANRAGIVSLLIRLTEEDPGYNVGGTWRSREYGTDVWRIVIEYVEPQVEPRRSDRQRGRGVRPVAAQHGAPAARPARPTRRKVR